MINPINNQFPPWSFGTVIKEPYKQGFHYFVSAYRNDPETSLKQRVFRLILGVSLIIPVVNIIVYIALRIFVSKTAEDLSQGVKRDYLDQVEGFVKKARQASFKILNDSLKQDLIEYVGLVQACVKELLENQKNPSLSFEIFENARLEFGLITSEIETLAELGGLDLNPCSKEALDWQIKIVRALHDPNIESFKALVREGKGKNFLDQAFPYFFGGTLFIHMAKRNQNLPYMRVLIQEGVDFSALERSFFNNTGLIWAIANASNEMAMLILENDHSARDRNRTYLNIQGYHGNTALHLAIAKGYKHVSRDGARLKYSNFDLVKKMVQKGNINLVNTEGNTPLHLACLHRDMETIAFLLQRGTDFSIRNKEGKLPKDLLFSTYEEASRVLNDTAAVFLLEKNHFQERQLACLRLFP